MIYEVIKKNSRLFLAVRDGQVVGGESPTHPCWRPDLVLGRTWTELRAEFIEQGFLIHEGN